MSGWPSKRLAELCSIEIGRTPSRDNHTYWDTDKQTDNVWVSIADMGKAVSASIHGSKEHLSDAGAAITPLVPEGALLLSFKLSLGKLAFAGRPLRTNEAIAALIPNDARQINTKFLYWYFRQFDWVAAARGSEKIKGATLNKSKLKEIAIPLPSLREQKRIVSILDEAFEGIGTAVANAEKNLANARELFDSYLTTVFSRHDAGWIRRPLSRLCEKITVGHVGSMSHRYKTSGIPFLRSQNIRPFELAMESVVFIDEQFHLELNKSRLRPGDIAVVRTGYPGTAAVIPPELEDANCSDLVIIRPGLEVNPHYLAAFFNSAFGKKLVLGKLVGAAQKHFNIGAAREVLLHYPSVQRQEQIVSELSGFRTETERLQSLCQRKIAALGQLKQAILQKAFAGELTALPAEAVQEAAE